MSEATPVWSVSATAAQVAAQRGAHVSTRMLVDLDDETETPRSRPGSGMPCANLSTKKHRATVKHPVRDTTHAIESWTRTVGDPEIVFNAPTHHERQHAEALPRILR